MDRINSISMGKDWQPSSLIHEIVHCWRGNKKLHKVGYAWEEGITTAITSSVANEYLRCYPHDEHSKKMLSNRGKFGNSRIFYLVWIVYMIKVNSKEI